MESDAYGIYKKLTNSHLTRLYFEARQALAKNDLLSAKIIIRRAIDDGRNQSLNSDVNVLQVILHEIELYDQMKSSETNLSESTNLDFTKILKRSVQIWCEDRNQLPQSIFYLRTNINDDVQQVPILFVGRKRLSNLYLANRIPELHCSQVRPSMLLGLLHHTHSSQSTIRIHYYPLEFDEKLYLFNLSNIELIYPFCLLHPSTNKELTSEPEGWLLTEDMVNELGEGETHLRNYSVKILAETNIQLSQNCTIYDPACSTGQFLATMKHFFPNIHTIGQDLSESMIQYAQKHGHVDEAIHADAMLWPFEDHRQVDIVFIRFLNSEVVTTDMALILFDKIANRVKTAGKIIVFGHTPVLLTSSDFLSRNSLVLEQCIGRTNDDCGMFIFQYYILRVNK